MTGSELLIHLKLGGSGTTGPEGLVKESVFPLLQVIKQEFPHAVLRLVIGGGKRARENIKQYRQAHPDATDAQLDAVGMEATWEHAHQLALIVKELGWRVNPSIPKDRDSFQDLFLQRTLRSIVAGGTQTGQSTDAVIMSALNQDILNGRTPEKVLILSSIPAIYTDDPATAPANGEAIQAYQKVGIHTLRMQGIIAHAFQPGLKTPIDPEAIRIFENVEMYRRAINKLWLGDNRAVDDVIRYIAGETPLTGTEVTTAKIEPVFYDQVVTNQWLAAWYGNHQPTPSPQ